MTTKPKFFRGRPIISPGEVYDIDGIEYKIITATSSIIGDSKSRISLTNPVFWLENTATKEMKYVREKELWAKFKEEPK